MNKCFPKEHIQMFSRYMKRCPSSCIIRKLQSKTRKRYHLTPVRMAKINTTRNKRCWRGCEKVTLVGAAWVAQWVMPLPSAQVMISGSWDQVPHRALCQAWSLLPPLSLYLLSLSVK